MQNNLVPFNIALDSYSAIICLLMVYSIQERTKIQSKSTIWFSLTCFSSFILSVSDIFTWISEGTDLSWKPVVLPIAHFIYYFCGCFIFFCYLKYVIELLSEKITVNKCYLRIAKIVFVFYFIGLILTPFLGIFYSISADNIYSRGKLFFIPTIISSFYYVEVLLLLVIKHKTLEKTHFISLILSVIIPALMQALQNFSYGIALNCAGISLSFLIIFLNLQQRLKASLSESDKQLQEKNETIILIQDNTIVSLSNLVENRGSDKNHHISRTRYYVRIIAEQCKKDKIFPDIITDDYINLLIKAAPMHDIGKIIIPDKILTKPSKLSNEEYELVKKHSEEGARIINEVLGNGIDPSYLRIATEISLSHHEKWDGTGYPNKLKAEYIPLSARIMAIADVFDALVSKRCYKDTTPIEIAFDIIKEGSGSYFDPILVREFLRAKDKITNIAVNFDD